MSETKKVTIKARYYLCLFITYLLLAAGKKPIPISGTTQPGDALLQAIGGGIGAVGLIWLLLFLINLIFRFFKKKSLSKKALTSIWCVLSTYVVLSVLVSPSH